jgi:hypothetical protein
MRILLVTPLYPPDVAEPAPYVKEVATRLSSAHTVTVLAYGRRPEVVPGVSFKMVSKQRALPIRLIAYTWQLLKAARGADIVYAQNGPSVELPLVIVSHLTKTPYVIRLGDLRAHEHAMHHPFRKRIEYAALSRARSIVTDNVPTRLEILPYEEFPKEALATFEAAWQQHIRKLEDRFTYAA